jgi:ElaB/YqjD/DUF883 family membrane-anchored ribosome-binding protein
MSDDPDRLRVEIRRLIAESDKFVAEQRKLMAEAAKFNRERWWQPAIAIAAVIGGLLGAAAFIAKVIS